MDQPLARLDKLFLGGAPAQISADPDGDPAARISPVSPSLMPRAISLIGFVWLLILGLTSITANLAAREKAFLPDGAAVSVRIQPGSHGHGARLRSGSIHRSHKHPLAVPRIVSSYDTSDNEATEDYDDDDAWDNTNGSDDDTDAPIMVWLQHMVPSLIAFNSQSAPSCTQTPSPLFLSLQRLRC